MLARLFQDRLTRRQAKPSKAGQVKAARTEQAASAYVSASSIDIARFM